MNAAERARKRTRAASLPPATTYFRLPRPDRAANFVRQPYGFVVANGGALPSSSATTAPAT